MGLPLSEAAASTLSSVPGTSPPSSSPLSTNQPRQPGQPEAKWAGVLLQGRLLVHSRKQAANCGPQRSHRGEEEEPERLEDEAAVLTDVSAEEGVKVATRK